MRLRPSLDWLLIFVPVALVLRFVPAAHSDTALFVCSCLAIVPVAGWMGKATEKLSVHLGEGVGGLLNATFGNAAELIIALMALSKGLTTVVKASITGSIIGNLLLVFGASALAGGLKRPHQKFNVTAARASATTLMLAAIALVVPTVFHATARGHWTPTAAQRLSVAISAVLILCYAALMLFTLKTHTHLFAGGEHRSEDDAEERWSKTKAIVVLSIATCGAAVLSEFLVGSIEAARERFGLTEVFVGVVIVAIIGNAAEHSTGVLAALKNKMDMSLSIAIGSSVQIALFVAPILVFSSCLLGTPMDLEFTLPEIVAVVVAVLVVMQISGDGESNWLEGLLLLAVYAILGMLFFFLPATH
jgi:Ca2+:H+ antiporter